MSNEKAPKTAWEILETWRRGEKANAFLDQNPNADITPTPTVITETIIEFVQLADTQLTYELWKEICSLIDKYGDTEKFREWLLEGGREKCLKELDEFGETEEE